MKNLLCFDDFLNEALAKVAPFKILKINERELDGVDKKVFKEYLKLMNNGLKVLAEIAKTIDLSNIINHSWEYGEKLKYYEDKQAVYDSFVLGVHQYRTSINRNVLAYIGLKSKLDNNIKITNGYDTRYTDHWPERVQLYIESKNFSAQSNIADELVKHNENFEDFIRDNYCMGKIEKWEII